MTRGLVLCPAGLTMTADASHSRLSDEPRDQLDRPVELRFACGRASAKQPVELLEQQVVLQLHVADRPPDPPALCAVPLGFALPAIVFASRKN